MSENTPLIQQRHEELFGYLLQFYDLADDIVNVVGRKDAKNRLLQLEVATPFVRQLQSSADTISSIYTDIVQNKREVTPELQETFEAAFREIFFAYREFLDSVEERLTPHDTH